MYRLRTGGIQGALPPISRRASFLLGSALISSFLISGCTAVQEAAQEIHTAAMAAGQQPHAATEPVAQTNEDVKVELPAGWTGDGTVVVEGTFESGQEHRIFVPEGEQFEYLLNAADPRNTGRVRLQLLQVDPVDPTDDSKLRVVHDHRGTFGLPIPRVEQFEAVSRSSRGEYVVRVRHGGGNAPLKGKYSLHFRTLKPQIVVGSEAKGAFHGIFNETFVYRFDVPENGRFVYKVTPVLTDNSSGALRLGAPGGDLTVSMQRDVPLYTGLPDSRQVAHLAQLSALDVRVVSAHTSAQKTAGNFTVAVVPLVPEVIPEAEQIVGEFKGANETFEYIISVPPADSFSIAVNTAFPGGRNGMKVEIFSVAPDSPLDYTKWEKPRQRSHSDYLLLSYGLHAHMGQEEPAVGYLTRSTRMYLLRVTTGLGRGEAVGRFTIDIQPI